jgi:hypothetical protein
MSTSIASPHLNASWHAGTKWRQLVSLTLVATFLSLTFVWLILRLEFVALVPLIVWAVVAAVVWRPLAGMCVAIALVSFYEVGGIDSLMDPGVYIHFGLQHTLGLSGVTVSPLEMLLLMCLLVWLVQGIAGTGLHFRGGHSGRLVLWFAGALLAGVVRGRISGGDMYIGFWELRPLLPILICYLLTANLVRTRRHVNLIVTSLMVGASLFAVEGAYRRVALIGFEQITGIMEGWYSHETVVFLASLVALIVAQQVFGAQGWQRLVGPPVLLLAVFTTLATERRAGQVSLIMAVLAVFIVLAVAHRKAFFMIAIPVMLAGAVYLPIFWNASGMLAQPARAIRSISDPDPRDAASNLSRELEKVNIRATLRAYPVTGVGFGQPFLQVVAIPDISFFPFWNFEPHHNLFWIWFKTGLLGFLLFWMLIGTSLMRAAHFAKTLPDANLKVAALLVVAGIVATLTFCYVDLGLTMGRVTVFLGTLIGLVAVLDRIPNE